MWGLIWVTLILDMFFMIFGIVNWIIMAALHKYAFNYAWTSLYFGLFVEMPGAIEVGECLSWG